MKTPKSVNEPFNRMSMAELKENHEYWVYRSEHAPGQPSESAARKFAAAIEKEIEKRTK